MKRHILDIAKNLVPLGVAYKEAFDLWAFESRKDAKRQGAGGRSTVESRKEQEDIEIAMFRVQKTYEEALELFAEEWTK